jgi:hypothetical protein
MPFGQPFLECAPQRGMICGTFHRPLDYAHTLVSCAIELRTQRAALPYTFGPMRRVPHWLRAEWCARPARITSVYVVETVARSEIAYVIAAPSRVCTKLVRDISQSREVANRSATHDPGPRVANIAHDRVTTLGEPQTYAGIEQLIGSRVPPML